MSTDTRPSGDMTRIEYDMTLLKPTRRSCVHEQHFTVAVDCAISYDDKAIAAAAVSIAFRHAVSRRLAPSVRLSWLLSPTANF
jgi:hypothetical protein